MKYLLLIILPFISLFGADIYSIKSYKFGGLKLEGFNSLGKCSSFLAPLPDYVSDTYYNDSVGCPIPKLNSSFVNRNDLRYIVPKSGCYIKTGYPNDHLLDTSQHYYNNCNYKCDDNYIYDNNTSKCSLDPLFDPESDHDSDGVPNKCDEDHPNFDKLSCNDNTTPNSSDPDIDGDGILNNSDSTPNGDLSGSSDTDFTCKGSDKTVSPIISGISGYPLNSYRSLGEVSADNCVAYATLNPNTWDSSFYYPDKNSNCGYVWCSVHELTTSCGSSYRDVDSPVSWTYTPRYNSSATHCEGSYNLNLHTEVPRYFIAALPSSCPESGYCFASFKIPPPDNTNSEGNNTDMIAPDLNTTSSDLAPLLQATNTSNSHLQDLKDKSDINIEKLEDIKNNLDDIKTNSYTQISELKRGNNLLESYSKNSLNALDTLAVNSASTNSHLTSLKTKISQTNNELAHVNNGLGAINENIVNGLFSDINPFDDVEYTDGSESFGDFESELSESFGILNESNIFGLTSISSYSLPTYTATISSGRTITIFEPSMLNGLPIAEIKALVMFMFALLGFIHTFRST